MNAGLSLQVAFKGKTYKSPKGAFEQYVAALNEGFDEASNNAKRMLRDYVDAVVNSLVERHSGQWPGGTTENSLSRRSGGLIEQIRESAVLKGSRFDNASATFKLTGTLLVHEMGAEIRGGKKLLTIPLPEALNSDGTPIKRSAREWDNTFVAETRRGNLIIFRRVGGRRIVPLYLLRPSVTIQPRLNFRATVKEELPRFLERAADEIVRAVSGTE